MVVDCLWDDGWTGDEVGWRRERKFLMQSKQRILVVGRKINALQPPAAVDALLLLPVDGFA